MDRRSLLIHGCAASLAFHARPLSAAPRPPVIGGPCEGCEWVFEGMPASPTSRTRIAPAAVPGVPLIIDGVVYSSRGTPAPNVIVYAYHTDQGGLYPPGANRHGSLRGWAITDQRGAYRFHTIRPGAYPARDTPEHVHMHVIDPGIGTYYIDNLEFADDSLHSGRPGPGRGGFGLCTPERRSGTWYARRDIVLGRNIPDHPPA